MGFEPGCLVDRPGEGRRVALAESIADKAGDLIEHAVGEHWFDAIVHGPVHEHSPPVLYSLMRCSTSGEFVLPQQRSCGKIAVTRACFQSYNHIRMAAMVTIAR
jgi:hypothetical protein